MLADTFRNVGGIPAVLAGDGQIDIDAARPELLECIEKQGMILARLDRADRQVRGSSHAAFKNAGELMADIDSMSGSIEVCPQPEGPAAGRLPGIDRPA